MVEKERLDILLVKNGLAASRELAKAYIMEGKVTVDGQVESKAGTRVKGSAKLSVKGDTMRYVSRGGYKLEKAMADFPISLDGKTCLDIGASTGGFTDCMLQNGAEKVYAVDVGYGQFAWKLRQDSRVVCLENTNIRYITREQVPDFIDFASIDVSFISLTKVLPAALQVMQEDAQLVCLIKPQFEAGREKVGKRGVVKESKVHAEVIDKIIDFADSLSLAVCGISFSPIKGPNGNIEYLIYLDRKQNNGLTIIKAHELAAAIVSEAHEALD